MQQNCVTGSRVNVGIAVYGKLSFTLGTKVRCCVFLDLGYGIQCNLQSPTHTLKNFKGKIKISDFSCNYVNCMLII